MIRWHQSYNQWLCNTRRVKLAIHIKNPPEAKPERISRLITRIEQGDIKIPVFQRTFVWKQNQVLELLDSIYRGYPIGSLLFWLSTVRLSTERNLGDFSLPNTPEKYPRNYILDGQQRLTTIYGVLTYKGYSEEDSIYNVSFDLVKKTFVSTPDPLPQTFLPMNILFDTRRFREFQNSLLPKPNGQQLLDESDVLSETFREYAIPVVTVTEATVEHVSLIFERINSTGTKLTVYDLMIAATWSENFDLRNQMDTALEELKQKDYAEVSPVAILQILAAHTDASAKRETVLNLRKKNASELAIMMIQVREGLKRAVDFLINEVNVKSSDFLPYERQLIALSFVFAKRHSPSPANLEVLRKWFWQTSFSERYRRGGEGVFDEDLAIVVQSLTDPSLLARFGKAPTQRDIMATEFRKNSALSNAFVALMASHRPRNLIDGAIIDTGVALSSYNRKEFHHIFPQALLRSRDVPKNRINSLSNICILSSEQNKIISDRNPSEYFDEIKAKLGNEWQSVLESNLIPQSALLSIENDDYDGFLKARSEHIAKILRYSFPISFMEKLC